MQKRKMRSTLRLRFFVICLSELVAVAILAEVIAWVLQRWLGLTPDVPIFVWAVALSVVIGTAMTNFLTRAFIDPIMKLRKAMLEVAGGNFHVTAECTSRLREVRDIYDSFNQMVRELGTTETLQTDFISSVSHEFKTPINAIEGYAVLLQDRRQSQAEQEAYVEKILFNTRRLSTLTGNILLLSKLNNQSIRPQKTRFRLDEQIRQAILALEQKWTEKETEFDVELDKIEYSGYENLLMHVWMNLIDNAVKFTPVGGLIRLRLRQENGALLFTIEDNGPGIPDGDQERIFAKFYQSETSREVEGNGLGLALVRQIVEISGGSVTVENLPEAGCRFTVRLPEQ